jgi:spore coat polysaccharide biosynthesis predicted glycosyltransferase SpsG
LIIDSYDIDYVCEEQLKIRNPTLKILSFDDTINLHKSDMVLNHGVQAREKEYKKLLPKKTKLFCGSEYTLLRDEFLETKKTKVTRNSVAIILGGNDVLNLSSKIADLLLEINKKYKITVITTSVNPNIKELKENKNIEFLVDINNMASVIATKSLVITASGGTLFEVLALKKKFINIEVASNQKVVDKFLKNKGIKTTIKAKDLTKEVLKTKIDYVKKSNCYKKLTLKFTKNRLVKKILKELK